MKKNRLYCISELARVIDLGVNLNNNFLKTLGVLFLFAGLLLLSSTPEAAAQSSSSGIEMAVSPAFGGNFKYGEWLPIWVTLSNAGPDLEGTIQVEVAQSGGNVTFAKSISLPAGARKQISLSILPNNFSRELEDYVLPEEDIIQSEKVFENFPKPAHLTSRTR